MIKSDRWKDSIVKYIGLEHEEKLNKFLGLFDWLRIHDLYVGSKHSVYTYINKNVSEFRANIYYKNIGIAKITIKVDFDSMNEDAIIVNKINKIEQNCYRLIDISNELDLLWKELNHEYSSSKNVYNTDNLIVFFSNLIQHINDCIGEVQEVKLENASSFLFNLIDQNIISMEELTQYNNTDTSIIMNIINIMKMKKIYKIFEIGWYLTINYEYFNDRVSPRFKYGNLRKNQYADKYILKNQEIFNQISKYVRINNQYNGFKIISLDIDNSFFCGNLIKNSLENYIENKSLYTIFIGQNGTGKTQALSAIQKIFQAIYVFKHYNKNTFEFNFNLSYMMGNDLFEVLKSDIGILFKFNGTEIAINQVELPSKLLASSYMINDKFLFQSFNAPDYDEENQFYEYLGVRDATNASHTTTISKRLVLNILKSVRKLKFRKGFRSILKYLELDNKIKINFQINSEFVSGNRIRENNIIEKIRKKNEELLSDEIDIYIDYLNKIIKQGIDVQNSRSNTFGISYELFMGDSEQLGIYNELELVYELLKLNIVHMPTIEIKRNRFYNVESASSGENHFLFNMINILTYIKMNSLVLIDEPEISLHPNWQYKYVAVLNDIFSSYNSHFLIATHSHFIISDLPPKQSEIVRFDRDSDGTSIVEHEESDTFGWSAENILYNIFHMKTVRNYYLEADLVNVLQMISSNSKDYIQINKILEKLKKLTLRDGDPLQMIINQVERYLYELNI